MLVWFHWWYWPCALSWYSPPTSSSSALSQAAEKALLWRSRVSRASASIPTPPTREAVPVKHLSMRIWFRPTASKIWAPQ